MSILFKILLAAVSTTFALRWFTPYAEYGKDELHIKGHAMLLAKTNHTIKNSEKYRTKCLMNFTTITEHKLTSFPLPPHKNQFICTSFYPSLSFLFFPILFSPQQPSHLYPAPFPSLLTHSLLLFSHKKQQTQQKKEQVKKW